MAATKKKPKIVKANCPTCDREQQCDVHGHTYKPWRWEDRQHGHSVNGGVDHSLLECRGCETVFYLNDAWDSESIDYYYGPDGETLGEPDRTKRTYPSPDTKTKPIWFDAIGQKDDQLQDILKETYVAYDNGAYILTAVGLRTALDRATEVMGIDAAISFEEKLQKLKDDGSVGATEHGVLEVITNAGHAAAHRGWSPSESDTRKLLTAVEAFLHRAFIVGQDALAIKAKIPKKPKRKPKV